MRVIFTIMACFMLSGCMTTGGNTGCAGWRKMEPSSGTRDYIIQNDRSFARDVVSHNDFGRGKSCWK